MRLARFEKSQPVLIFSQNRKRKKQITDYHNRIITTVISDDSWQMALAIPDFKTIGRDIKAAAKRGLKHIGNALANTFIPQPIYAG